MDDTLPDSPNLFYENTQSIAELPYCQQFGNRRPPLPYSQWHCRCEGMDAGFSCRFVFHVVLGEQIPDCLQYEILEGGVMLHGKGLEQFMRGWRKITGDFLFAFASGGVESTRCRWCLGPGAPRLFRSWRGLFWRGLHNLTHSLRETGALTHNNSLLLLALPLCQQFGNLATQFSSFLSQW
jgi:hypothetical protein